MIYTASKTKHAPMWIGLRAKGWPIISTWIDEAGEGQTQDFDNLWERCLLEASICQFFLLYREPGEILKGAWIELGAALTGQATLILAIGIEEFTIAKNKRIRHFQNLHDALSTIRVG